MCNSNSEICRSLIQSAIQIQNFGFTINLVKRGMRKKELVVGFGSIYHDYAL